MTRRAERAPTTSLALALLALALAAACGQGGAAKPVRGCEQDLDCGGTGHCVAGLCQASAAPVADFTAPAELVTQRELALTSTAHDPDPGDSIAEWAWTARADGAACEPELTGEDRAVAQVVFWCPGRYRIGLTVTDATGTESPPLERTLEVVTTTTAPALAIASAASVHHRCAGSPLRCGLEAPLALAAQAEAVGGGPLTYRWSLSPGDAARPGLQAAFAPSAESATPTLQASVAGTGVVGTWTVQVRARDSAGNLALASRAFAVANRPPVLRNAAAPGSGEVTVDHTVGDCPGGGGRCYLAAGAEAFTVEDPDGDPLDALGYAADASGAGAGSTAATGLGGQASAFRFATPLGNPAGFRAADGASGFHVTATAADVHGAAASLTLTARIGNRAPVVAWSSTPVRPSHLYAVAAQAYQAGADLAGFQDPDGDPLWESGSAGDAVCGSVTLAGGTAHVACQLGWVPVAGQLPPLATFVAPHTVTARVSDGWATASARAVIEIQDRPPAVPAYAGPAEGCRCVCTTWSTPIPGEPPECLGAAVAAGVPVTFYPAAPTDLDGDPLLVSIAYDTLSAQVTASDGASSAAGTWTATEVVCAEAGASCTP